MADKEDYAPGSRVVAISKADDDNVYLLGFGTYVGDEKPAGVTLPDDVYEDAVNTIREMDENPPIDSQQYVDWMISQGELKPEDAEDKIQEINQAREAEKAIPIEDRVQALVDRLLTNPKIELDNGSVVWGYQCWWFPESRWEEFKGDRNVVPTTLEEVEVELKSSH